MFDNKFLKHDPLVEAVKQAQQDGELRRQAEAYVNEQFGVYSRNALTREDLAGYDISVETVYQELKEGKKLADKDYDKDGKIESPKDEVWGSRLRAAKQAGKMEEEQAKVTTKHIKAKDREGYINASLKKSVEAGKNLRSMLDKDRAERKKTMKEAELDEAKGTAAVQNLKHRDFKETRHPNPGAVTKAPVPGVSIAEEDRLDEVSKGAAISAYRGKEAEDRPTTKLRNLIRKKWGEKTAHHAERAGAADTGNLVRKGESHGTDYLSRAKPSSEMRKTKSGKVHKQDVESKKSEMKFRKTMSKFDKPRGHLPEEHIDEAAYSAKAARAGKDIGKPGKMFSKIASKAGAKYGSEERGKKVAGAILAKIRAKHMKEENIQELSAFGSAFAAARKGGQTQFSFGGKSYNTKLASPGGAKSVAKPSAPTPPSRAMSGVDLPKIDKGPAPGPASGPKVSVATPSTPSSVPTPPKKPEGITLPRVSDAPKVPSSGMPNPKVSAPTPPASSDRPTPPASAGPSGPSIRGGVGGAGGEAGSGPGAGSGGAGGAGVDGGRGGKGGKGGSTMSESVQVGDYKYRIV